MELTTTAPGISTEPGKRLRAVRLAMPPDYRTQAAFGAVTGYSDGTLSRFEKGGRPVPTGLRNVLRMLEHLQRTLAPADLEAFLAGFERTAPGTDGDGAADGDA